MQNKMQSCTAPGKKLFRKSDLETHHFFLISKENKSTSQGAAVFFQCADSDLLLSPYIHAGKCLLEFTAFSQRATIESGPVTGNEEARHPFVLSCNSTGTNYIVAF